MTVPVLALAATAYTTNLGGIQRTIQLWVHGDQTDAVMDMQNGQHTLSYEDANGEQHEASGGGWAVSTSKYASASEFN